jgi:adenylate cyclase, class 2
MVTFKFMKKEIEVKILNINRKKLKKSLKELGAKRVFRCTLFHEIYWESPSNERQCSSFRLRSEGRKSFLALKLKKDDSAFEIRDEFEVEVGDFKTTAEILELVGFKVFRQREKLREEYLLENVKVEIDEYPGVMPYMEIEASSKQAVKDFLKKINFPLRYTTNRTATEIIQDAGLNPNKLLFNEKNRS